MLKPESRIFVAGHRGLVGSAISRRLRELGHGALLEAGREALDLTDAVAVSDFFEKERPEFVFLAAAKVGGILANSTYPAEFLAQNLRIQDAVITAAMRNGTEKLVFLGSSCIYPRDAVQPITEDQLLAGPLEPTNQWYAIAKIAGIKLVQAYRQQHDFAGIAAMPTNLYGPNDNFDPEGSHVIPGMLRRFHEAKLSGAPSVTVWGSGTPKREFLHVDDLADALVLLMNRYDNSEIINVGTGEDITIAELAQIVAEVTGYAGEIAFDTSKPDGAPRKVLNIDKIRALGWQPKIDFRTGLAETYRWYCDHVD
ncbi:MAG: GDP-L-fucose synthase [Rhodospirillaceae bacterium]|jgi:GDP-L-fucose synthase|nr:GDP-L-fucose synthase [Rhodospirillaceae bacterium]MBT6136590.1 GDP-L-fucose synthase [Rhodospirillaceae bacterium]